MNITAGRPVLQQPPLGAGTGRVGGDLGPRRRRRTLPVRADSV